MIIRGKDVQHHNIVNDMMITEITYRPQPGADKISKDSSIVAVVTMGFVKDAKAHIDVQGYNVYHKNRLIKPFWRLWNSTGSDGRGVISVLEANFVEPAHDKQGFERTIVLSRLETRLIQMQKTYWRTYCHKIVYAPRVSKNSLDDNESSLDYSREASSKRRKAASRPPVPLSKRSSNKHHKLGLVNGTREGPSSPKSTPLNENIYDDDLQTTPNLRRTNGSSQNEKSANKFTPQDLSHSARSTQHPANSESEQECSLYKKTMQIVTHTQSRAIADRPIDEELCLRRVLGDRRGWVRGVGRKLRNLPPDVSCVSNSTQSQFEEMQES